ncbi:MFS transporter [Arthrobacter sp. K5]|uniref:Putative proline/betaine transporter n=1 Tax=Arthrobacter sp. K5 TaxID=2839623 RepID=A0AAU8EYH0_9MICC
MASTRTKPQQSGTTGTTSMRRLIAASLVGTTIEWYDFFIYGSLAALVFNKLFFPDSDPLVGTMLALGSYAVGFAARPLGGIVFGHFGDKLGRKKLLIVSMLMMGGSTVLIGLLPTYAAIGIMAPVLLTLLRVVQGVALGGEWGGAVLILAEQAKPGRRGFAASWPQVGAPLGNVLAAGVLALFAATLPDEQFLSWGWRVPFLLSALLLGIGYWVRISVSEPKVFEASKAADEASGHQKVPVKEVLTKHPKALLQALGGHFAVNVLYYTVTAFALVYVTQLGSNRETALVALMIASGIQTVLIPLFGAWSDKVGRKVPYLIGASGMLIFAFALFPMLGTGSFLVIVAAMSIGLILHGLMYGPQAAFYAELFPTRVRYTGISVGVQLASVFAGSMAPIIATALLAQFNSWIPVAIYLAICAVITMAAVAWAPETYKRSLTDVDSTNS